MSGTGIGQEAVVIAVPKDLANCRNDLHVEIKNGIL